MKKRSSWFMLMVVLLTIALGSSVSAEPTKKNANEFYSQHNFIAQAGDTALDKYDSAAGLIKKVLPTVTSNPDSLDSKATEATQDILSLIKKPTVGGAILLIAAIISIVLIVLKKRKAASANKT